MPTLAWLSLVLGCSSSPVLGDVVPAGVRRSGDVVLLEHAGQVLRVSTRCPWFLFDKSSVGGAQAPARVGADPKVGNIEIAYAPQDLPDGRTLQARLFLQWSRDEGVLRKWVRFRLDGDGAPFLLRELALEQIGGDEGQPAPRPARTEQEIQSQPLFVDGFFVGLEFPIADTRKEGAKIIVSYAPGLSVQPGKWYESRKAVFGVGQKGLERKAFETYIAAHRPTPRGLHFNYNSWWTSPVPYTQGDILQLIKAFQEKLHGPLGAAFDTFCIDAGWANKESVWQIDRKLFPESFKGIQAAAANMDSHLGLWISPSNCYSGMGGVTDNKWAHAHGYETFSGPWGADPEYRFPCLGGPRYRAAITNSLVEAVTRYGVRHIKFDGYRFTCPEASHGHAPGELSGDAVAEGMISVFQAVREAAPETWMETTCFGWSPSPWWLFDVNSVIGTFGDDAPAGRVPCPVYRESYTTARDFYNLQGEVHLPIPPAAQEVLGIVHQTPEPLLNDAVISILRGHMFQPMYINPAHMNDRRWEQLADLMKWARAHEDILGETQPLPPSAWIRTSTPRFVGAPRMPREPYGYAHWPRGLAWTTGGVTTDRESATEAKSRTGLRAGLVALRNPWIVPQSCTLQIPDRPAGKRLNVVSVYPEVRTYASGLEPGARIDIPLAPYETVVLSIGPASALRTTPPISEAIGHRLVISDVKHALSRVQFRSSETRPFGDDWTSLIGEMKEAVRLTLDGNVDVQAPEAELLVLLEGISDAPVVPLSRMTIDGEDVSPALSGSASGWRASGEKPPEHWLFLRAPMTTGRHAVHVEVFTGQEPAALSAWAWAFKPGASERPKNSEAMPAPEVVSLDSAPLLDPIQTSDASPEVLHIPAPIERIKGVYLDTLTPVAATQGWGKLQKNRSVWGKPLTLGGRQFARGLGTHAPGTLKYTLDGSFKRFQAWAGVDGAASGTVLLEVRVDGRKKWESGPISPSTPPHRIDLDITRVKTLELVCESGGSIASDHVDWADARLLK